MNQERPPFFIDSTGSSAIPLNAKNIDMNIAPLHPMGIWNYIRYVRTYWPKRDYSQIFTNVFNGCILFLFKNLLYWALIFSSESTRICWECFFQTFHKFAWTHFSLMERLDLEFATKCRIVSFYYFHFLHQKLKEHDFTKELWFLQK